MFSWFSGLFAPKQMQYHLRSDVHCHLLPGLDDGAKTEELSETLLADFANIGVQRIAFTPHVAFPRMPNSHQTILDRFQKTLQRVQQLQIPLQLSCGAEYRLSEETLELFIKQDPLPFRENFVLLEHSMIGEAPCFDQAIFTLRNKGFRPVLAHPERYPFFDGDICKKISNIKHDGTLIQINILSLAGFYGPDAERKACKILKKNLVDFIASDCHSKRYFDALHDFLCSNTANKLNKFSFLN